MSYVWDKVEDAVGDVAEAVGKVYDIMEDAVSDIYHAGEKIVSKAFREFFRVLGVTGENILTGDVFSQKIASDNALAKNVMLSNLIKYTKGNYSAPEYIMNLLVSGKFKFTKTHSFAKNPDRYARGLPTLYFHDTIDMKETEANRAQIIAKALEGQNVEVDYTGFRIPNHQEYIAAGLYANWNYDPITNTLSYKNQRYSYYKIAQIGKETYRWIGPEHIQWRDLFAYRYYNISVVQYDTITCTVTKIPFVEVKPTKLQQDQKTVNLLTEGYKVQISYALSTGELLCEKQSKVETTRYELISSEIPVPKPEAPTLIKKEVFGLDNPVEKLKFEYKLNVSESIIGTITQRQGEESYVFNKIKTVFNGHLVFKNERKGPTTKFDLVLQSQKLNFYEITLEKQDTYKPKNPYTIEDSADFPIRHSEESIIKRQYTLVIKQVRPGSYSKTHNKTYYPSCTLARYDMGKYTDGESYSIVKFHKKMHPDAPFWFVFDTTPSDPLIAYDAVPTLEGLLSSLYNFVSYSTLPVIPLKENGLWLDELEKTEQEQVRKLLKRLDITDNRLLEGLKKNENANKVTEAYIHFAITPTESKSSELIAKYFWHLVNDSLDAVAIRLTGTFKRSYTLSVIEQNYNMSVSWKVEERTYTKEVLEKKYALVINAKNKSLQVKKQVKADTVETITFKDIVSHTVIKRGEDSLYIGKTIGEQGFHFPVLYETINLLSPYEQIQFFTETLRLSSYASEYQHLKYYQTAEFADLIEVVSIGITIMTLGAGIEASGFLMAMAELGLKIAISYGLKLALEYVYEHTDNAFIRAIATVAAIAGVVYTCQKIDPEIFTVFSALSAGIDLITFSMRTDLQIKQQRLSEKQESMEETYEKRMKEYTEILERYSNGLDTYEVLEINETKNWKPYLIGIDAYYEIALGGLATNYSVTYNKDKPDGFYDEKRRLGFL